MRIVGQFLSLFALQRQFVTIGAIVQAQNDDVRLAADVAFTARVANAVDRVVEELPTITPDFFDDDDWLEDLIDDWPWEE